MSASFLIAGELNSWEGTNLVLQSLENGERKLLMEDAADGRSAPTGVFAGRHLASLWLVGESAPLETATFSSQPESSSESEV